MVGRVQLTRRENSDRELERLPAAGQLTRWNEPGGPSPSDLQELATGCECVICLENDRIDAAFRDAAAPLLNVVSLASMGFDAVDQQAAADRVAVGTHTPGVRTETTADLAFALIVPAHRRLINAIDSLRREDWESFWMRDYLGLAEAYPAAFPLPRTLERPGVGGSR